jgi:tetratricopeptide (TPR) repeat protein
VGGTRSGIDDQRVFISHSASDAEAVHAVVRDLETEGIVCWIGPRDVQAGLDYAEQITSAIQDASALVFFHTAVSAHSEHCKRELDLAMQAKLRILPVLLDDTPYTGSYAYRLAGLHWVDGREPAFVQLLASVLSSSEGVPSLVAHQESLGRGEGFDHLRRSMPRPVIAGRQRETEALARVVGRVEDSGTGHVVLIGGDSGVGKSVLSQYLASEAAARGHLMAATVCEPFHEGMSFFPVRELMRQLTGGRSARAVVRELYGLDSVETSMANLAETEGIDATARRDALLATFANLTLGISRASGRLLLLTIDDLERADAGTVDSLLCLLARIDEGSVLVLGTYRTDDASLRHSSHPLNPLLRASNRSTDRVTSLAIAPVGQAHIQELAESILGGRVALPSRFLEELWRETEGNPLYCREVLRSLHDSRADGGARLELDGEVWRLVGDLVAWQTPTSVEDAIRSRLEIIEQESRTELERASVIGKRFAFSLMSSLTATDENDLLSRLEECINLSLIQEVGGEDDSFEFTHGKIRDVLYESMTRIRRRKLHSTVADSLIAMASRLGGDWGALVGEHLYRAGRYAEAVPYLQSAAQELMRVSAAAEASRILEQALSALTQSGGDAETAQDLRLALVEALVAASEYAAALTIAVEATSDADVSRSAQGWFHDLAGDAHWALGDHEDALVSYGVAEAIAVAEHDQKLEMEVCADLAELHERWAEQISGVDDVRAEALTKQSEEYLDRQIALVHSQGDPAARARALRNEAKSLRRRGEMDAAIAKYEEATRLTDPRVATHSVLISYAKTLRLAGRYEEAVAVVKKVLQWSNQTGARRSLGIALHYRAMLGLELDGPTSAVEQDLNDALAIHEEIGYGRGQWEVNTLLGEYHALRGAWAPALGCFRQVVSEDQPTVPDDVVVDRVVAQLGAIAEHGRSERLHTAWSER